MTTAPRPVLLDLPALEPADGLDLDGDHDRLELRGVDLAGCDADDARFSECALVDCRLDDAAWRRASLAECRFEGLGATAWDLTGATLRTVVLDGCRVGALTAVNGRWDQVQVTGGKLDLVSLRGARLADVTLAGVRVGELDLGGATVHRLALPGTRVDRVRVTGATLADLDLSGADLSALDGLESIRGTTLSRAQLLSLAPALAAHLGVEVAPD